MENIHMRGNSDFQIEAGLYDQVMVGTPLLCGADSVDMEVFLEDHWQKPVTSANVKQLSRAFVEWFAETSPDEFVDPRETAKLHDWGGARPNAGRKGNGEPLVHVRLRPEAARQLAEITAYQRSVRGDQVTQPQVVAEIIQAYYRELAGVMGVNSEA